MKAEEVFYSIHQGCKYEGGGTTYNYRLLENAIEKAREIMKECQAEKEELWSKDPEMLKRLTWRELPIVEHGHIKFNAENDHDEIIVFERSFDD